MITTSEVEVMKGIVGNLTRESKIALAQDTAKDLKSTLGHLVSCCKASEGIVQRSIELLASVTRQNLVSSEDQEAIEQFMGEAEGLMIHMNFFMEGKVTHTPVAETVAEQVSNVVSLTEHLEKRAGLEPKTQGGSGVVVDLKQQDAPVH